MELNYIDAAGNPVPLWEQYFGVVSDLFTLDFGESWTIQRETPVTELIINRMPATLWLGFWSVIIALGAGVPLGLYAGLRANTLRDYTASGFGIVWRAMPNFWLAVIISGLITAGGALEFYRTAIVETPVSGTPDALNNLFTTVDIFAGVPYLSCCSFRCPISVRCSSRSSGYCPPRSFSGRHRWVTRSESDGPQCSRASNSKYVETDREGEGLSPRRIIVKHVGRNAVIPLLPVIMGEFYLLVGGSVLVEAVFGINGLGNLFFNAVLGPDIPLVMALVFIFIVIQILFNIGQDLLYTYIDPRISL